MSDKNLRYGYTTGSCAAAAVKGAAQMLRDQQIVEEVVLPLPCGQTGRFRLHGQRLVDNTASCYVVKDAGDDPDITNGVEVHATAQVDLFTEHRIIIQGGVGIGKVTKPGLAVPVGEWAINPVPLRMMQEALKEVFAMRCVPATLTVTLSIPNGEELAKKTLNERLGIVGGLSILGTSGIVKPISTKAWTDTIDAALDVARACGCQNVVLSTGRSSELAAQQHLAALPEEACIMMGDHVAYALQACARRGYMHPIIACQFAKLLKIACGHPNTHAAASELDLAMLREWAEQAGIAPHIIAVINQANTAREIAVSCGFDAELMQLVATRAAQAAALHSPGIVAQPLLCGYDGNLVSLRNQSIATDC